VDNQTEDLSDTVLIKDYLEQKTIPTADVLLDWRIRLKELKTEYPRRLAFLNREIMAVDYLLSRYFVKETI